MLPGLYQGPCNRLAYGPAQGNESACHAVISELVAEPIALRRSCDVQVIHVVDIAHRSRQFELLQVLGVPASDLSASGVVGVKMTQLDIQNRGLHFIQPRVHAPLDVVVAIGLAIVAQNASVGLPS